MRPESAVQLPIRAINAGLGFAVNRHALNMLRVRGVSLERGDTIESGPLAETGVDRISIGSLTKNVKAVDLSLRFEKNL